MNAHLDKSRLSKSRPFGARLAMVIGAVVAVGVGLVLLWQLHHLMLLIFAAMLLAIFLDGCAGLLCKLLPFSLPRWLGLVTVGFILVGAGVGFCIWLGPQIIAQLGGLEQQVPVAMEQVTDWLKSFSVGRSVLDRMPDPATWLVREGAAAMDSVQGLFTSMVGVLTAVASVLLIGIYLAADPDTYMRSVGKLVPFRHRQRGREIAHTMSVAMKRWLVGRLASMTVVGVLTTVGLWILGMPMALGLGFLTGMLSFIPFLGPVMASVPAILIALLQGPGEAMWVAVIYIIVQALEGNIITPLIQLRAVSLPPALIILSQLVFGTLVGMLGVLLATPLALCACLLIRTLYIEDVLGDEVPPLWDEPEPS